MAQSGYTPLSLYYSATASTAPLAANLVAGELALNTNDGKLYYKDSGGVVQVIATKAGALGTVTSVSGTGTVNGLTLTGTVTSSGSLTLGGTLDLSSPPAIGATSASTGKFTSLTDTGLTSGRVTYATTGGLLTDNANFVWDITNSRLGIGTTSPAQKLQVNGISRFYTGAVSTVGAVASSALLIDGAGTNGNISQIGFGYDATATYMPAAIYGITTTQSGNTAQDIAFATRSATTDTAPTERMRITSGGNVLIGTTSGAYAKLAVLGYTAYNGINSVGFFYSQTSGSAINIQDSASNYGGAVGVTGDALQFYTGPSSGLAERMRIDSSGRLGLGVTPSSWSGFSGPPMQFGYGSVYTDSPATIGFAANSYYNGGWKYVGTGNAGLYQTSTGAHYWFSAVSGTAGNAISFVQLLQVDNGKSLALQGTSSQTGTGITFPATQSASSDANTLDDYEEGTWTPTFTSWGGTFTTVATYAKIGRVVYFNVTVTQVSGTVTSIANSSSFTLPFTVSAEGVFSGSTSSISSNGQGVAYSGTTAYSPTMSIVAGKGYMTGFYFTST
jgi:hypothetical protein